MTDQVLGHVMLGQDGKWGDDVGHVKYDPGLRHAFVTTQQLPDPDNLDPNLLPPTGNAWLVEIDPLTRTMAGRLNLPNFCITPYGLAVDSISHIAFVARVDSTPATLVRIDLQHMQVIQEDALAVEANPDMLIIDANGGRAVLRILHASQALVLS